MHIIVLPFFSDVLGTPLGIKYEYDIASDSQVIYFTSPLSLNRLHFIFPLSW